MGITAEALTGLVCDLYTDLQTEKANVKQLSHHLTTRDQRIAELEARVAELNAQVASPENAATGDAVAATEARA